MSKTHCPNCQSENIIPNVDVVENTNNLAIRIYEKPDITLKSVKHYPLKAWVCTNCGYTQLYVANPTALATSYTRFLENS
jgi:predicted nucleic-acid-binding Zn-ribbon protein